jgi:hypothetical protein
VFGGRFTSVNGVARSNIARLQPDGTLDTTWDPSANDAVEALAIDPAGTAVYASGRFLTIGTQPGRYLAKLQLSGGGAADATWNPSPNNEVDALAVDPANGAVYAGGFYSTIGGQARNRIAKLSGTGAGAADATWNPSADVYVRSLALDASGDALYVGGGFTTIGGRSRNYIAKISASGTGAADATWNPSANNEVLTIAIDPQGGSVYAGGFFSNIGGQQRRSIAKLSSTGAGTADLSWNPTPDGTVYMLAVDADSGNLYVGGAFWNIGGKPRNGVARLSTGGTGTADPSWDAACNGNVAALAFDAASGTTYAGGAFSRMGGGNRLSISALDATGAASGPRIDAEQPGVAATIGRQPDGGLIVGGWFLKAGQTDRRYILRLNADGSLDPHWNPTANDAVRTLVVAPGDSAVFVGGSFTEIGGAARNYIARLAGGGSGAADANWNPSANLGVETLVLDETGASVFAGGSFTAIGGQSRAYIAKLSSVGSGAADADWNPSPDWFVRTLAYDPPLADELYVGGYFTSIGGAARNHIAKVSGGTGGVDANWDPSADSYIHAIAVDAAGGSVYASGAFHTIGGQARSNLAKLSSGGTGFADVSWNPAVNGSVTTLAVDAASGTVYMGGLFSNVGGQFRNGLAKLLAGDAVDPYWNPAPNDDAALVFIDPQSGAVDVGGAFSQIGGQVRTGLAALPLEGPQPTTIAIDGTVPNPSVVGQSYAVNFSVTAVSSTPVGTVTVVDDLGASCVPVTLGGDGTGSCMLASTAAGTRTLTARFTPDDPDDFILSARLGLHLVTRAATTLTIASDTPDPSLSGQPVAVTVTFAVASPGAGVPSGGITIGDGVEACAIAQASTSCSLTLTTRGPRTLTANYAGDDNFAPSSATATHLVNRLPLAQGNHYTAHEDVPWTTTMANGVLANDSDPDGDALSVSIPASWPPPVYRRHRRARGGRKLHLYAASRCERNGDIRLHAHRRSRNGYSGCNDRGRRGE